MKNKINNWTAGLISLMALQNAVCAERVLGERPNILFVMVDDLSPFAVGGGKKFDFLKTPVIDRLVKEGAVFEHMYVATSLCSPSRATMITGTYAHIHGVRYNAVADPDPALPTFPRVLQQHGYRTALIGKWHMKDDDNPRPGFDYWLGFRGQGVYFNPLLNENGRRYQADGYITDILTEKTMEYISQPSDQPFCILLWHKANHEPFEPAPRHKHAFGGAEIEEPFSWPDTMQGKPQWKRRSDLFGPHLKAWKESEGKPVPDMLPPKKWVSPPKWVNHLRCMLAVDEGLGRIMGLLEQQGRLDNTFIIFTSDNGYLLGEHRRGDKRVAYEESMRIPFVVRYPKSVPSGSRITELCVSIDVAPSLLNLAGAPVPAVMQGQSFIPLLEGKTVSWRKAVFYQYFQEKFAPGIPTILAVRSDRWKYVHYPYESPEAGNMDELYDQVNDPYEMRNLISSPEFEPIRRELWMELEQLKEKYNYTEPLYRYVPGDN